MGSKHVPVSSLQSSLPPTEAPSQLQSYHTSLPPREAFVETYKEATTSGSWLL